MNRTRCNFSRFGALLVIMAYVNMEITKFKTCKNYKIMIDNAIKKYPNYCHKNNKCATFLVVVIN